MTVNKVPEPPSSPSTMYATEPFNTFLKTFSPHGDLDYGFFRPLLVLLERISAPEGLVLWQQGDEPDGMYMIQEGVLRASYRFADYAPPAEESMVPDTLAGELTALSGLPRNATVVVERQAVLWKFSIDTLRKLEVEQPAVVAAFTRLVLKCEWGIFWFFLLKLTFGLCV